MHAVVAMVPQTNAAGRCKDLFYINKCEPWACTAKCFQTHKSDSAKCLETEGAPPGTPSDLCLCVFDC